MNDVLGHPIVAGSTVLTGAYWSPTMDQITTVEKVTKTKVYLSVPGMKYNSLTGRYINTTIRVGRHPHQLVVVDKQLKYNKKTYPENLL